jgi:hypothetical protein
MKLSPDESHTHTLGMLGRMLMPERSTFARGEHDRDQAE